MDNFTEQENSDVCASDALVSLVNAVESLRKNKPNEESELAQIYATTIIQVKKALAYFKTYAADALIVWSDD